MADQPIKPPNTRRASTVVGPRRATPISITEPPIKPFTKEETAESLKILTDPKKEVKPMAEVKDPRGMFDYTGCEQYTVQDGESLFDVAQKYKVALQQLRYFNHVPKDTMRVKPKQTLYIPKEPVLVPVGE